MQVVLALVAAILAGCTHDVSLSSPDGRNIGQARLDFDAHNAGSIVLRIGDSNYLGEFTEQKVDEGRRIAEAYGLNSRKYREYQQGNGSYQWRGKATLHADNGDEMQCEFIYRGTRGRGTCTSATDKFDFVGEG
jgi:hypothetical protein